jgi:hypothetical protein
MKDPLNILNDSQIHALRPALSLNPGDFPSAFLLNGFKLIEKV